MATNDTKRISITCIGAWLLAAMASACTASAPADVRSCQPGQLAMSLDDGGGDFNGMSHGGTYVVLRNVGATACRVPARPDVTFLDAQEQPLRAALQPIRGMHPGPVLLPVEIAAQARVRASLRWVTGEVFDDTQCIDPAYLRIDVGAGALTARFRGHLCGSRAQGPLYEVVPFQAE
ncbi:MAG: DUF4232 domain-containing protein [Paraburkholderia sp.]|jgi:hypothetical protein|nr:DUF4232 domain-containing protein [Paraburkholderia sp.]